MAIGKGKRTLVWAKTDGHCWYCGRQLIVPNEEMVRRHENLDSWFVIDHIQAQIHGGSDDLSNLLPACYGCNKVKRAKSLEEYRSYLSLRAIGVTPFTSDQIDYLVAHGITLPLPDHLLFWGEKEGIHAGE